MSSDNFDFEESDERAEEQPSTPPKRKSLGKGLSDLLNDFDVDETPSTAAGQKSAALGDVQRISIDLIEPNPEQPRRHFDDSELNELADSIRARGVIQPILVRSAPDRPGHYEIVAGERRWRAAQRAKLHEMPVVIRELDDTESLEVAIIENVQRSDLNAMEEAFGYQQLIDRYAYTQDMLAKNVGKSRSHIANTLRLVNMPSSLQDMVRTGELTAGHARAALSAADPETLARKIVQKGMSVREAEQAAKQASPAVATRSGGKSDRKDADTRLLEGDLSAALRMPVAIVSKGKRGGELRISYRSLEDLDELCRMLRGEEEAMFASS
ncbi:MAG: ParB/RepB/Spo0J family partition protein [Neomegalonema sp.]|nr:ParB/RepB/Spo0J family partition protein [Neomegalonema sp.]